MSMSLLELLKENRNKKEEDSADDLPILNTSTTPLLVGRPSKRAQEVKARAITDPAGLLNDLAIQSISAKTASEYLLKLYDQMLNGNGRGPAAYLADYFQAPRIVRSKSGKQKGIEIKMTNEALAEASNSGAAKKILRTYAFWFQSALTASKATQSSNLSLENAKFQYSSGTQSILIYLSRSPWGGL